MSDPPEPNTTGRRSLFSSSKAQGSGLHTLSLFSTKRVAGPALPWTQPEGAAKATLSPRLQALFPPIPNPDDVVSDGVQPFSPAEGEQSESEHASTEGSPSSSEWEPSSEEPAQSSKEAHPTGQKGVVQTAKVKPEQGNTNPEPKAKPRQSKQVSGPPGAALPLVFGPLASLKSAQEHQVLLELPGDFDVEGDVGVVGRVCATQPSSAGARAPTARGGVCLDIKGEVYQLSSVPLQGTAMVIKLSNKGHTADVVSVFSRLTSARRVPDGTAQTEAGDAWCDDDVDDEVYRVESGDDAVGSRLDPWNSKKRRNVTKAGQGRGRGRAGGKGKAGGSSKARRVPAVQGAEAVLKARQVGKAGPAKRKRLPGGK